jgi:hypothetical protein
MIQHSKFAARVHGSFAGATFALSSRQRRMAAMAIGWRGKTLTHLYRTHRSKFHILRDPLGMIRGVRYA